jgi:hypothetical protein
MFYNHSNSMPMLLVVLLAESEEEKAERENGFLLFTPSHLMLNGKVVEGN